MKDFLYWLIAIAAIISPQIKYYYDLKDKEMTTGRRIAQLSYGMVGSVLTFVVVYELGMYFELPEKLSLACGAALGYLGGETVKNLVVRFIERKIDSKG